MKQIGDSMEKIDLDDIENEINEIKNAVQNISNKINLIETLLLRISNNSYLITIFLGALLLSNILTYFFR